MAYFCLMHYLEYNETQKGFHENRGNRSQGTHGWETIAEEDTDKLFSKFCTLIRIRFTGENNPFGDNNSKMPSLKKVKELWVFYRLSVDYDEYTGVFKN